jgi:hypothetical protein
VLIRGDQVLLRWKLWQAENLVTGMNLTNVDGFEFVATVRSVFGVRKAADVLLYASSSQFKPTDWTGSGGWSLANGRICCRANTNTTNLLAAIGTEETLLIRAGLFATHKVDPPPVDVSSSSSGESSSSSDAISDSSSSTDAAANSSSSSVNYGAYLTCLWLGDMLIQNDVWRIGQGDAVEIVLDPPIMNSSSSSSSSTEAMTTSSSESSSESSESSSDSSASSESSSSSSSGGDLLLLEDGNTLLLEDNTGLELE